MDKLEKHLNYKLEKCERKIARYGETGKGSPYKLDRELTALINLMIENSFDYDPYYEEWDGYEQMIIGVEEYNLRKANGSGSD